MDTAPDLYRTLSLKEAAEYLHVHEETLRNMALAGKVRGVKPGRAWVFLQIDLVEYLRGRQGERWDSSAEVGSGGLTSASADAEYGALLGLPTGRGRRSITTGSRKGSGGSRR